MRILDLQDSALTYEDRVLGVLYLAQALSESDLYTFVLRISGQCRVLTETTVRPPPCQGTYWLEADLGLWSRRNKIHLYKASLPLLDTSGPLTRQGTSRAAIRGLIFMAEFASGSTR
ncbi:hypothetical protein D2Q93_16525 [Alicyclobacillaceae bacterium I2511]|nr:hypothetical protein D2Q93_16525 [Alicyclobacillaceae bacterium I2511]